MKFTNKVHLAAFKASLPVLLGYSAMGMAAGLLLTSKLPCIHPLWGTVSAITLVSGTIQFLLVGWFIEHLPLLMVAILTLSVNLRYALYGLPMIERWKNLPWWIKLYLIHTLTDETFALQVENNYPEGEDSNTYCLLIATFNHMYWIIGVTIGCIAGNMLAINTQGIEFAMTALFIVIIMDQLSDRANHLPCGLGFFAGIVGLLVYRPNMLIPAIAIIIALLIAGKRKISSVTSSQCIKK